MEPQTQFPASDSVIDIVSSTSDRRNDAAIIIKRRHRLQPGTVVSERSKAAVRRWGRARTVAAKIGKGVSQNDKAQILAPQFWLEAIDPWHRHGDYLHFYNVEWLHSRAEQHFFHWLEIGEGKGLDLIKCPRSLLEKQRLKYLAPVEREDYEVMVKEGKLIHKRTGEPLTTTGDGKWMFVLSPSRVLYVGRKEKGEFHHSSFLAGAATLASGRLVAQTGVLKAVWPVSAHYQPTEKNFKEFISFLKDKNLDLTNTTFSPESFITDNPAAFDDTTTTDTNRNAGLYAEWVFSSISLVLEILLVAMDQCASPSKAHYSLVAVVVSYVAILVCMLEVSYKAWKEGVVIKRQGMRFRLVLLYPSSPTRRPFFTFIDLFAFLCALYQFILSLIAYSFYRRHADNPIKVSIVSIIFLICVACSRLARHHPTTQRSLHLVPDDQV